MAKRLTSYERARRERERKNQAARKKAEAAYKRSEKEEERQREVSKRQIVAERKKLIRETTTLLKTIETSNTLTSNKEAVEADSQYIEALTTLHVAKRSLKSAKQNFTLRLRERKFEKTPFEKNQPFSAPNFVESVFKGSVYMAATYIPEKYADSGYGKRVGKIFKIVMQICVVGILIGFMMGLEFVQGLYILFVLLLIVAGLSLPGAIVFAIKEPGRKKIHDDKEEKLKEIHSAKVVDSHTKHKEKQRKEKEAYLQKIAEAEQQHIEKELHREEKHEKREIKLQGLFNRNEIDRLKILTDAKDGNQVEISLIFESLFPMEQDPKISKNMKNMRVGFSLNEPEKLNILIRIPTIDDFIPKEKLELSQGGKSLKSIKLSERYRYQQYDSFIASLAFCYSIEALYAYPYLNNVNMEIYDINADPKTGGDKENIRLNIVFDMATMMGINFDRVEPLEALDNFRYEFLPSGKKSKKEIAPVINRKTIKWTSQEKKGRIFPYGLIPSQTALSII